MFRDPDSGEWNMTANEERWAHERARELAAEAFNRADSGWILSWLIDRPTIAEQVVHIIKLESLSPPLRPVIEEMRVRFIDEMAECFFDEACEEIDGVSDA